MKRILSLVLALVLVLGSVPVAFADSHMTAGEMLKQYGFVAGDQNGNLMEDQKLTREQMMVLVAEMNGVKEEAATFGIPADFSDVSEDDWFAPYVWYAFYQGWTAGMGDGTFGAGNPVDSKMAATWMMKALGYEVADYNMSVEQAAELGITVANSAELTRGEAFEAMWQTVNLPKLGSDVALGVELGRLEAPEEVVAEIEAGLDEVLAIGNTVVEVYFDDDVDADAAEAGDYVIVKKGTSEELEIKDVVVIGSDWINLETEAMTSGQAYTLVLGDDAVNFTGIAKDSDKPEVDTVKGTDTDRVEVKFDMIMDRATAEDIANYSVDRVGTVTGAELQDDNKTVELVVEGFTKVQSAKLTVENVLSVDGVTMVKTTKTFYSRFDKAAPTIETVEKSNKNNVEVDIYFSDDHGVDKATAQDISNYSIEGLEILKAEADDMEWDGTDEVASDFYKKVTLTTSEQSKSKKYTLEVLYMVDGSSAANATTKVLSDTFYGGRADDTEPSVLDVTVLSLDLIEVVFDEDNYLDPASALDLANYSSVGDEFDILDAQFKDGDDEEVKIWLTVSELDSDESYKLEVNNVADNFGNVMDDEDRESFRVGDLVTDAPTYVKSVKVLDLETLEVTFGQPVTEKSAEDPTNYAVNGGVGRAVSAEMKDGNEVVTVEFEEMDSNKSYTLTVNGVETFSGYATEDAEINFIATATDVDTDKPEVESVDNEDEGILMVEFSEEMDYKNGKVIIREKGQTATRTLDAVATIGDDDEIVVFDAEELSVELKNSSNDKDFEIVGFTGVYDTAKNTPDYDAADEEFEVESGYDYTDYELEYDGAYQENVNKIYVEYDEAVSILVDTIEIDGVIWELDTDEDNEVVLENPDGTYDDEDEIIINLRGYVGDLIGRDVASQKIEIEWDADDDVSPEIVEVRAINDHQVEVVYDEDIAEGEEGTYDIVDEDDEDISIDTVELGDEDYIVLLTLDDQISSDMYYTLTQNSKAEDLQGNNAEEVEDGIEFIGNSTPYVANTIDGIAVVNGMTVKIIDDEDLPTGFYSVLSGGTVVYEFTEDGTETQGAGIASVDVSDSEEFVITFEDFFYAFVETETFTINIGTTSEDDNLFSEDFDGVIEALEFDELDGTALEVSGLDEDSDQEVLVYVNGVATTNFTQDDDVLTITGLATTDFVKVVVLDADSQVVLQASENVLMSTVN